MNQQNFQENTGFVLINLLPYRQKIRSEKIRELSIFLGVFAFAALSVVGLTYASYSYSLDDQQLVNRYLERENKKLDQDISEIANLKEEIRTTLAKRQVVESLQVDRSEAVLVMNELANRLPEGSLIKSIKRFDQKI